MPTAEAPQFVYSKAERTKMLRQIQDIAAKDEVSDKELEELGWLVLKRDRELDGEDYEAGGYMGSWKLPSEDNPKVDIVGAYRGPESPYFRMYLHRIVEDGLEGLGELVLMDQDDKGSLRWRVGNSGSFYSELLAKRVPAEVSDDMMAESPLTPSENALVARALAYAYQGMLEILPKLA